MNAANRLYDGNRRFAFARRSRKSDRGCAPPPLFLAPPPLRLGPFPFTAHTGLLVKSPLLHFLEHSLFGEFALEHPHRLIEGTFDPDFHTPPLESRVRQNRIGAPLRTVNRVERTARGYPPQITPMARSLRFAAIGPGSRGGKIPLADVCNRSRPRVSK